MSGFEDFATGFAGGFAPSFTKAFETSQLNARDKFKFKLEQAKTEYENGLEKSKNRKTAGQLAEEFQQPKETAEVIAQWLDSGRTIDKIREDLARPNVFKLNPAWQDWDTKRKAKPAEGAPAAATAEVSVGAPTAEGVEPVKPVDAQMSQITAEAPVAKTPERETMDAEGMTETQADFDRINARTAEEAKPAEEQPKFRGALGNVDPKERDRIFNIMGITESEYLDVIGYGKGSDEPTKYIYTPSAKNSFPSNWNEAVIAEVMASDEYRSLPDEKARTQYLIKVKNSMDSGKAPTNAETQSFQNLIVSDEYVNADPTTQEQMLMDHKDKWAKLGKTSSGNETAEQLSLNLLTSSASYINAAPDVQQEMLLSHKQKFSGTGSSSDTLTQGSFAAQLAQSRLDLLSPDQATREKARAWLEVEKPVLQAALTEAASATNKNEPAIFNIRYQGSDGRINVVEATKGEDGSWIRLDGQAPITKDQVKSVMSPESMDVQTKTLQAASTVYTGVTDKQSAVSVAAAGAYELDRIAARTQGVLTIAGPTASFFTGAKNNVNAIMALIQEEGQKGTDMETVLQLMQNRIGDLQASSDLTNETAGAYQEFSAAVIRYVFAAGKALGQSGNGFSNSDYENVFKSIQNSTSYETFSNNLRNFTKSQIQSLNQEVNTASSNPLVVSAMEKGNREYLEGLLVDSRTLFERDGLTKQYQWSQGRAKAILKVFRPEDITDEIVSQMPALGNFRESGAIIFTDGSGEAL
jgi:hypothetical protein